MTKLHYFQKSLLKKLILAKDECRFNSLLIDGLGSEHMNYHLQKLVELGLVEKTEQGYRLTDYGKDYGNLMDDAIEEIEKQPKTSVLMCVARKRAGTTEDEYLVCRRLRQPYYGMVGFLTGKVRFGESLEQAVRRELMEESGLSAGEVKLLTIYHKIRRRGEETIQDVIFYRHLVTEITGELIEKTEFQENFWITAKELYSSGEKYYDTLLIKDTIAEYEKVAFEYVEDIAEAKDF